MKTKKKPASPHLNWKHLKERDAEITRVFNGQPVVDAKNDLRVSILDDDINKGIAKDFNECVFAQACKRQFLSQKVLLMKRVAYLSLPDEFGNYRVERFIISSAGMKLIADFDRGIMPKAKTSFVFAAPTPSETLNAKIKYQLKFNKLKRQAKLKGKINGSPVEKSTTKTKMSEQIMDVRNGSGLIQMSRGLK